jgi:hypothetical protein
VKQLAGDASELFLCRSRKLLEAAGPPPRFQIRGVRVFANQLRRNPRLGDERSQRGFARRVIGRAKPLEGRPLLSESRTVRLKVAQQCGELVRRRVDAAVRQEANERRALFGGSLLSGWLFGGSLLSGWLVGGYLLAGWLVGGWLVGEGGGSERRCGQPSEDDRCESSESRLRRAAVGGRLGGIRRGTWAGQSGSPKARAGAA